MKKILLWTALCCSATIYAQQDSTALDEVIVTASRMEQKQQTTGKVVIVIDRQTIEANAGKTLSQLLNEQAGIVINGALSVQGSPQTLYMRGASSGRASILIDGIPVYDPSMINNEFDPALLSLQSIQRIEICKGAQSSLYGSDAIAGVINIITIPQHVSNPVHITATAMAGNRSTTNITVNAYGKINRFKYAVDLNHNNTHGFSAALDTTGKKNFDKDGFNLATINGSASYEISKRLTANGFVRYTNYTAGTDEKAFTDDKDFNAKNNFLNLGLGLHYTYKNTQVHWNYSSGANHRDYRNDSIDVPTFVKYSDNKYTGKNFFTELYGSQKISSLVKILFGLDYRKYSMSQTYESVSGWGAYKSNFNDSSLHQFSFFATLFNSFANGKINIETGARYNMNSMYGNSFTYTVNPSIWLHNNWKFFASLATGFKAPSIYQVYDAYSGNKDLKAEKSFNVEGGVQFFQNKFSTRLVYFNRSIKNGIDYNYASFKYFNFNQQFVHGIEYEMTYKPSSLLTLMLNYTLLKAHEQTEGRLTQKETSYAYLLRRPRDVINATLVLTPIKKLTVTMQYKFTSKRYDAGGYIMPDVVLKKYGLFNCHIGFEASNRVSLFVQGQNVFNKSFSEVYGYTGLPFTVLAGLRVKIK